MQLTETDPLVVGVSGSLNDGSVTRLTVERTLDAADERGARTELLDLREFDLPMLDPGASTPSDADRLNECLGAADAIILGTPMYNGSYSSPLKTAIDYADPDHFAGLPVGLVGVSGGQFPLRALDHLRAVASHMDARVLPHEIAIANSYQVDDELPEDVAERVDELGAQLAGRASIDVIGTCRAAAPADD